MITIKTAEAIAKYTEELQRVRLYIECVDNCSATLLITPENGETMKANIDTEMLSKILVSICKRYTDKLDELNYLAVQEAQNNEVLNESSD